jgi:hypothetical protein
MSMKCKGCKKNIEGSYMKADGYAFHPECFACDRCGKPIRGSYQKSGGKYFDLDCYKQRAGLVCDKCGKLLQDKWVDNAGKKYHLHCHDLRCDICGKPLLEEYLQDAEGNYHESCFKSSKALRCDVCEQPIMGKYIKDPWGHNAHERHLGRKTEACEYCSRLMSDVTSNGGYRYSDDRLICGICKLTAVNDGHRLRRSHDRVLQLLSSPPASFRGIPRNIPIQLVDKPTLKRIGKFRSTDHGMAFTQSEITLRNKQRIKVEYRIYILTGLPQLQFEGALAHEFMHVWLIEKDIKLSMKDLEGFCNLACALVYRTEDSAFARFKLKQMADDPDRWYGKGYRKMSRLLERIGWRRLKTSL